MRSIDLDSLDIFRTVATEGGVIRAAQKLNRVSNVTTRIKQLEKRLGRPLFRKQGRGLVLSPEGELLLSYAQRLFRHADEAETTYPRLGGHLPLLPPLQAQITVPTHAWAISRSPVDPVRLRAALSASAIWANERGDHFSAASPASRRPWRCKAVPPAAAA